MIRTTDAYGLTFAYPAGDTVVGPCLARYGEFARITTTFMATYGQGGSVIDVGANIGAVALPVSRFVREVIAIEAHPGLASLLALNAKARPNIRVMHAAAGVQAGEIAFPVIPLADQANFGGGGVGTTSAPVEIIRSLALDDIAPSDLLAVKIDVEGAENDVLIGASNLLSTQRPIFVVEFNSPAVIGVLAAAGYRSYWMWEPFVTPMAPKQKWRSRFRGDLSILSIPAERDQPGDMVEAREGDAAPASTAGFEYLRRFGITPR